MRTTCVSVLFPKCGRYRKVLSGDTVNSLGNTIHVVGLAFPKDIGKNASQIPITEGKKEFWFLCALF
jgi:hypothetical protein